MVNHVWYARAHTNIALVKYWGKRGSRTLNLPAVSSLSMSLSSYYVDAWITQSDVFSCVSENTELNAQEINRVRNFVTMLQTQWDKQHAVCVHTRNQVPKAAGLASSSAAFAAITKALAYYYHVENTQVELARLARRGSGSAGRSIIGAYAVQPRGQKEDSDEDCNAYRLPVHPSMQEGDDALHMIAIHTSTDSKKIGSTQGMEHTTVTSPYYAAWCATHEDDMTRAVEALHIGDLPMLGKTMEHSTMKMHACMLASQPALMYWNAHTMQLLHDVTIWREEKIPVYATMDAGPHVKLLCRQADVASLTQRLLQQYGPQLTWTVSVAAPAAAMYENT